MNEVRWLGGRPDWITEEELEAHRQFSERKRHEESKKWYGMTISPQELRIGNWVMKGPRNDFEQISHVSDHKGTRGVIFYNQRDVYGHDLPYDLEFVHPIPLNEQWLEDFGFEFGADVLEWGIDIGEDKSLHVFKESGEYFCCIKELDESATFPKEVGSVHTLQNLFWCLTGQELEFKKQ